MIFNNSRLIHLTNLVEVCIIPKAMEQGMRGHEGATSDISECSTNTAQSGTLYNHHHQGRHILKPHGINFLRAIQSRPAIFLSGDLPGTQRQAVTGEHEQKTSGVAQENHAASDLLSGPAASHFSPRSSDTTHSVFQASTPSLTRSANPSRRE